jgi:hypothetical protein
LAIDNPNVIDVIGTDPTTCEVVLSIADHLEWDDDRSEHLLLLQEKINRYIGFIESGELLEFRPDAVSQPIHIHVVCKYPPSEDGERFLALARGTIEQAGWSFTWRWWPGSQDDV